MKIKDLHPSVKDCLKKYVMSLKVYYAGRGFDVKREEVFKVVSEKLKKIHILSVAGNPEDRIILIQVATEKTYENGVKELRYHRVVYDRLKKKGSCTCEWFSKNRVCKHILKVLLLHHHGGSFYRRKLSYPAYKGNRKSYTTTQIKTKVA